MFGLCSGLRQQLGSDDNKPPSSSAAEAPLRSQPQRGKSRHAAAGSSSALALHAFENSTV